MLNHEEAFYHLALSYTPGIGKINSKNLISYCGGAKSIFEVSKEKFLKIPGTGAKLWEGIQSKEARVKAEREIDLAIKKNIKFTYFTASNFPKRLKEIPDSPIFLFYFGNFDFNPPRAVAIVGTRSITNYGREVTEKLVSFLQQYNVQIISGLAYGVDIVAHRKCVDLGIQNIGVLGSGVDKIYPLAHKDTAVKMVKNGGLISEKPLNTKPESFHFPERNRLIAGLSDAVVVVEASKKGGALITANLANDYHREVFAIPGPITSEYSEGCNMLVKHLKAHIVTRFSDISECMNWDQKQDLAAQKTKKNIVQQQLTHEQKILISAFDYNAQLHIDQIAWKTGFNTNKTAALLLELEFLGIVKALPGKQFSLV
ncbi:MAG: DNA-processing protein DprA [Cyclobacteriaceae bacterium]|nr:DNA-processing protein DprA [Cyclobacteriaceae bacterium]MCH8517237.1 DNA-processing protein DprA [Cyclobacteriaceae bacterium]